MAGFRELIAKLKRHYGPQALPDANGAFELVIWENACYLLPDERRAEVFHNLKARVGITPQAILDADPGVLLTLARRGGMRPEDRVAKWREIARIAVREFEGNLEQIPKLPHAAAIKALQLFPSIGYPGAQKILTFCHTGEGLPLDSNGLRVLTRIGYGYPQKSYDATYKAVQNAVRSELSGKPELLAQCHLLLRTHGKELCKAARPDCMRCPIAGMCAYARK